MLTKSLWIYLAFTLALGSKQAIPSGKEKIQWISLEDARAKSMDDPKPTIIDLYARWCYWCKVMDHKTYNDQRVIEYINQHFYPVKLDAETPQTIQWSNRDFDYDPNTKVNEFSLYLTNGQLSFPTTVIYTNVNEAPATIPGYMSPDEIEPVLKYFGEKKYLTQTFEDFMKGFKKSW